jgi:HlyD family secretion protein
MRRASIFRKVSLDRLASPEQLDQLMRVTDSGGWVALLAIALLLLSVAVWSAVGSVPQTVAGMGILIRSGGVSEVVPLAGGRISDVAVEVGDLVHEGQVVARMAQPELTDRLQEIKTALANLEERHVLLAAHYKKDAALQSRYLGQERATMEEVASSAERNFAWWSERSQIQETLGGEGLLTRQTVLATRQQQDLARQRLNEARSTLAEIAVKELDLRNRRDSELRVSEMKIQEQRQAIAELTQEIRTKTEIAAPCAGRVIEVMTEEGALVARGDPVLTLDRMASRSGPGWRSWSAPPRSRSRSTD